MTGKYIYREDLAIADLAFEVYATTLNELFKYAALAITNGMVKDLNKIEHKVLKTLELEEENLEMLLFNFLQEVIFLKDSEQLLFSDFEVEITVYDKCKLFAKLYGEKINPQKHELLVDVKAVTMHMFELRREKEGWFCRVIVDV